ncbi:MULTISPECIES: DUF2333 family protein [Alteromonadaceae]|uniref:DUF2333 family protein n=1 Tax=Alteromonadaceae TaxID=72275 RepID=UPI001C08BF02|nr:MULTISPECIES: DUF2333 family protein [Aliiglaciecola]MBU2878623.1 DUF2333 family protein [Aliiglaciecola lipolytica]MDO6709548.1 DUF2333 family protein [Aliiglaciecola sp. 2_MG-2023]MDO6750910.1 DUF2333 family protein [Aliiglaciecola sp. 1_MG-2023]
MQRFLNAKWLTTTFLIIVFIGWLVSIYWSSEPDSFNVRTEAQSYAQANSENVVVGYTTTHTLIRVVESLMDKPGGYLSNDVMPPGIFMDNMPRWEFGVLEMSRDLALAMRKDFSRSQSQSMENPELIKAQPALNMNHLSWMLPSAESMYQDALKDLYAYRTDLADKGQGSAQFFSRADNLRDWLKQVEKRLGNLSQKLSASVGQEVLNTDLAGDAQARQSTPEPKQRYEKTSWWKTDDNFYEARGAAWALIHFLKAVEVDFADVLEKKNATVSLRQIIRELESTQQTIWSPMILNGSGLGMLANHSLVMANYISRANAALIELNELLNQG